MILISGVLLRSYNSYLNNEQKVALLYPVISTLYKLTLKNEDFIPKVWYYPKNIFIFASSKVSINININLNL